MFSAPRAEKLNSLVWAIPPSDEVEYIEAFSFSTDSSIAPETTIESLRFGSLKGSQIQEWLLQNGKYAQPQHPNTNTRLLGGIRLVISERVLYQPASFSIDKETYLSIERQFHLPQNTLLALSNEGGVFSRSLEVDENTDVLKRMGMVIKAAQKFQIGNYGLSFSHDFTTGFSTGLLHGTGVVQGGNDFRLWTKCPSVEIFEMIKSVQHLWTHPLLLPTLLLQHHVIRTDFYCTTVIPNEFCEIQRELGATRAGRLHGGQAYEEFGSNKTVREARLNLHDLTSKMSTFMDETIWFCRVSEWQCACIEFLGRTLSEVTNLRNGLNGTRDVSECIQYLASAAQSIRTQNNGERENGQADISVLYNIISQVDNRLNAKMAAAASRDSSAMKTLAFLTTLFLPGTYVASIFSTGMFDWRASGSGAGEGTQHIVASLFWIYWAITVPLTVVVAIGWRLWWSWEKRQFDRDVHAEIEAIEKPLADSKRQLSQVQSITRQTSTNKSLFSFRKRTKTQEPSGNRDRAGWEY